MASLEAKRSVSLADPTSLSPLTKKGKYIVIRQQCLVEALDGPNRQSPIASVQRTQSILAGHSAGPHGMNTTPTNSNRAIRITAQRTQGLPSTRTKFCVFRGRYDCQRTLVIRIAAITLASNSAISKKKKLSRHLAHLRWRLCFGGLSKKAPKTMLGTSQKEFFFCVGSAPAPSKTL